MARTKRGFLQFVTYFSHLLPCGGTQLRAGGEQSSDRRFRGSGRKLWCRTASSSRGRATSVRTDRMKQMSEHFVTCVQHIRLHGTGQSHARSDEIQNTLQ